MTSVNMCRLDFVLDDEDPDDDEDDEDFDEDDDAEDDEDEEDDDVETWQVPGIDERLNSSDFLTSGSEVPRLCEFPAQPSW
ncbi:MAG TPA: hypothetical protein VNR64_03570 [Vicinamibacterales bacterium]|nr:hypothetical protein [Vicinamibacterales bacterium]